MRSDDEILRAIAKTESGGDPNAVGKSGEVGQYQFMPDTIRQLGGDPAKLKGNAAAQDELARKHLAALRAKYGEDDNKIIAAWNAGTGGVDSAVKKGGDWQKNLPKGTNKFGAQYDTGAYVQKVNQNLPQETMPQTEQPQSEPQQPNIIPVSVVGGPEQTLAEEYHARRKAQAIQWMMQDDAPASAPAQESPKPAEKPKEQGGGIINAIGSGLKTLATPFTAFGKAYADALYPAHPQGRGPQDRGIAENVVGAAGRSVGAGVQTMGTGLENLVQGAGELLNPSPEEAARRSALPPEQQAAELGQHLLKGAGDFFAATPFGGAAAAAGHAVQETAAAIPGATDEQLQASIAQLKAIPMDALQIAGPQAIAGRDEQVKRLESLLMMPKDQRDAKLAEEAGQAGETAVSLLPMPLFLGVFGKAGKAFQLASEVKAARAAVIAQAAEKAAQPAAEAAHVAAPVAREAAPAQRLAMIEQDPAARQVINDIVEESRPSPVASVVENVTFNGQSKRAVLGHNDNMVVARDANGKDIGYLWYTREGAPGEMAGYTVRKIETLPEYQRKGVASKLDQMVQEAEGPYLGSTDKTAEGASFRAARTKLEPAPEPMYRDMRDAMHGDPDLTKSALESRGYKLPELGEQEAAAVHEAMGVSKNAAPAEKAAAADALNGVAADIGIHPETGVEALPAITRLMKAIPEGDLKSIREIIAEGMKNADNPLSALRAAQMRGQEGRINAGTLFVISRAALGGVLGGMQGDDPQTQIRNVLLGAGIGAALSPKLARTIADNIMKPEVREALTNALTLHGEEGVLRFPARGVGKNPSPNTDRMGVSPTAKRVVRGINEKLEEAKLLSRAETQTHAMTQEAARHSQYATVEKVLSLDSAKLSPDELASAGLAARNVRDAISEKVIEAGARVKLNPGDAGLEEEFMTQMALLAKSSQQVTNLETAFARATNALAIESDVTAASKFDLRQFAGDVELFKGALTDQGKVSAAQLAEMVGTLADKAATAKLASVASKWPPAIWNVYYGLNLLSSPLTHARNFIGNTGALGMAVIDRAGGEILGPLYRVAGYKGETVALGETYHLIAGIMDTVADSFRAAVPRGGGAFGVAKKAYQTGLSKFEGGGKYAEALGEAAAEKARMAGDGTLPWLVQTMSTLGQKNMRAMSSVDEFFKVLSFQGELRALARRQTQHLPADQRLTAFERLVEQPTTSMYHGATEFAHENTFTKAFTEEGAFGGLGKEVEGVTQSALLKMTLTPFYRTPMRIGEFSTVHTPIINALAPQFWSDMKAGGAKQQLAIAKIMTGTAMMGLTAWWASHGYITGAAPSDPKLRKQLEDDGWQEFSVYVPDWVPGGGRYISYANIEPVSTIVGTMATFTQSAPDLDEMTIGNFMSAGTLAVSKNALNKQWWQGLSDFSDMLEAMYKEGNAKPAMTWLARKTAALIPGGSASRYINNATDPYQHEPEIDEWKRLADIYAQNTPGWGGRNALELVGYKPRPAAIQGITGEPLMNENQWLGLIAPFRISKLKNDPVLDKLVELGGAQLPKDLIPKYLAGSAPASPFKLTGADEEQRAIKEGVLLSTEQRHRLGELLTREVKDNDGNTLHQAMAEAIRDPDFEDEKGGPDGGQAHRLANIYHDFLKEASAQLRDEYPDIDIAIMRRKLERDGRRFPKSMDWLLNEGRQELEQEAASRSGR